MAEPINRNTLLLDRMTVRVTCINLNLPVKTTEEALAAIDAIPILTAGEVADALRASAQGGETAKLKELLGHASAALEFWYRKSNPDWDGNAQPRSLIAELRPFDLSEDKVDPDAKNIHQGGIET
jgi:hypothetical protein